MSDPFHPATFVKLPSGTLRRCDVLEEKDGSYYVFLHIGIRQQGYRGSRVSNYMWVRDENLFVEVDETAALGEAAAPQTQTN